MVFCRFPCSLQNRNCIIFSFLFTHNQHIWMYHFFIITDLAVNIFSLLIIHNSTDAFSDISSRLCILIELTTGRRSTWSESATRNWPAVCRINTAAKTFPLIRWMAHVNHHRRCFWAEPMVSVSVKRSCKAHQVPNCQPRAVEMAFFTIKSELGNCRKAASTVLNLRSFSRLLFPCKPSDNRLVQFSPSCHQAQMYFHGSLVTEHDIWASEIWKFIERNT